MDEYNYVTVSAGDVGDISININDLDDLDDISINADDLANGINGTFSGSFSSSTGVGTVPNIGTVITSNTNISGANYTFSTNHPATNHPAINLLKFNTVPKSDVKYVIVLDDDSTLELVEQPAITVREMIGLCKFLNMVSATFATATLSSMLDVRWSDLIVNLNIKNHFVAGKKREDYDISGSTQYIFLIDV